MKKGFYWPAMPEPDPQDLFSKPFPSEEFLMTGWRARWSLIVKYRPKLFVFRLVDSARGVSSLLEKSWQRSIIIVVKAGERMS